MAAGEKKQASRKKEQIVAAAEGLFIRHGVRRVTVEEICRQAHVAKMTFYKYFPNKIELVRHIKNTWTEEAFRVFDEISALDLPFPEKIERMTAWKAEFASRLSAEFIRDTVHIDDDLAEIKRRYLRNIRRAQIDGEIRLDIQPELLWLVLDKIWDLVRDEQWRDVCSGLGDFQKQVRTLIFYGLLVRPGYPAGEET